MNIEESVNELEKIKEMFIHLKNYGWINDIKRDIEVDKAIESIETLLTAYEKEKEKNKSLEQENSFLKMLYRGTAEFKAIEKLAKEE